MGSVLKARKWTQLISQALPEEHFGHLLDRQSTPYSSRGACIGWAMFPVWRTAVSSKIFPMENWRLERGWLGDPSCTSRTSSSIIWRHWLLTLTTRRPLDVTDVPADRKCKRVFPHMKTPWCSRQRQKRAGRKSQPHTNRPALTFCRVHSAVEMVTSTLGSAATADTVLISSTNSETPQSSGTDRPMTWSGCS